MNWRDILITKFEEKRYQEMLSLLKSNITNHVDEMDSSIQLIYVYFEIIDESDLPDHFSYIDELQAFSRNAYKKYSNCPEFLFCVAYIALSFGEFFMGVDESDIKKMLRKPYYVEPNNILYQWGHDLCTLKLSDLQLRDYALRVLEEKLCLDQISNQVLVYRYILQHLYSYTVLGTD